MKLKAVPENILDWIAMTFNLAPAPMLDTQIAFTSARAIMAGAELGIFESLGKDSKTFKEIADSCKTHPAATKQLLDCLVGIGYLKWRNNSYSLRPKYYKWLLKDYSSNIIGKLRFQISEWNWVGKMEDFVRTGKPLELHSVIKESEWANYQQGMRDLSGNASKELAGKIRLPANPSKMLDIGGSHGLYSIELCKKYPSLSSIILELPGAIDSASAMAAQSGLGDRVQYQAGNALTDDLGEGLFDLIMINNVVHHFTEEQNILLAQKVTRALKPGGMSAIGDVIRGKKPGEGGAIAPVIGLYFSLTSESGTWSIEEITSWQKKAGLKLQKQISLMTIPGWKMVIATK
jgi:2-polyprenyl-3-methyl-5-hydroxy-6-metoxy-1,4-benzoquinol methylase